MSKQWYECRVKHRKTDSNGNMKVVTEPYLVDAVSFSDAESIITQKMTEYLSEEFRVTNIKPVNYAEIHKTGVDGLFFKSKVSLIAYDEESGRERKSNIYLLIEASHVDDAYNSTLNAMKNTMGEYSIPSISETAIVDVFEYESQEQN